MRTLSHCRICAHVHDELIIECRKDASLVRMYTKPYDTLPLSICSRGYYHLHRLFVRKNKF